MTASRGEVIDEYHRAVAAAEAQTEATGSSALSTPGVALPELSASPSVPLVKLTALTVSGGAPVEVQVAFETAQAAAFELVVQISDTAGRVLFASTLPASVPAGPGRARLTVDHLGFAAGTYRVVAQAFPPAPHPTQELRAELALSSPGPLAAAPPSWKL